MSDNALPSKTDSNQWWMLGHFAVKTAIVAIALTISSLILVDSIISGFDDLIDRKGNQIITKLQYLADSSKFDLGHALDRAVKSAEKITPERKAELLSEIHTLADWARPFIFEAEIAFSTPAS